MAVQWYCAPAIGHMDAISAKERAVAMVPVIESSIPHTKDEGPPFIKPGANPLLPISTDRDKHHPDWGQFLSPRN